MANSNHTSNINIIDELDVYHNIINTNNKCVIKFTGSGCPPCKQIQPIYEQCSINERYHNKVHFLEVDVDIGEEISDLEDISSLPTFVYYHNGQRINEYTICGAFSSKLIANLDALANRT